MGKAVNYPLVFDFRVDKVYLEPHEIDMFCVLRKQDYGIHFTKKKNWERFTVNSPVGLALERFYFERRGDAKEIFRLGSKKADKKAKQRAGFTELNVLD